jgi:hypothetical protein
MHDLLVYGDGVNLLGEQNPYSDTRREVGLKINAEN